MDSRFFRKYIDILSEANDIASDNNQETPDIVDDLVLLFRNLIGRADSKESSQVITYHTLNGYLANIGSRSINFDELKSIYDQYPDLKGLIKDFDQNNITLYTKKGSPEERPVPVDQGDKEIKRMAKSTLKTRGLR